MSVLLAETSSNPGGTGLEQSPSDCGDGRGDSGLTPGGAGGGRAPGNPIHAVLTEQRLELRSTREFPRRLVISYEPASSACTWVIAANSPRRRGVETHQLGWAANEKPPLLNCRSNILWLGRAAFDVSADEARRIRETFAPHGLCIQGEPQ